MKLTIKLPGGAEITWERQPMEPYKLYTIAWCICISIVLPALFSIFR